MGASWPSSPLSCPYFCLQGASWSALGRLRGRSKVLLSGPWALQDGSQDSFQRSWGPKGSQNGAREGPKSGPGGDSNQKRDFFKNYFQLILMIFDLPFLVGLEPGLKMFPIATSLQDGCPTSLGWLPERSWRHLEAKKVVGMPLGWPDGN